MDQATWNHHRKAQICKKRAKSETKHERSVSEFVPSNSFSFTERIYANDGIKHG